MNGLNATSRRIQTGGLWVLGEMWSDKIIPFRKAVDEYVEPFMEKALEEKRSKDSDSNLKKSENSILLDYLVEQTSGMLKLVYSPFKFRPHTVFASMKMSRLLRMKCVTRSYN